MRVLNKDWWDVVLLHFTYAEWKQRFRMTGHLFMTLLFTAHAQYFPVSVFNPIKCLHVISFRLQKE